MVNQRLLTKLCNNEYNVEVSKIRFLCAFVGAISSMYKFFLVSVADIAAIFACVDQQRAQIRTIASH